MTWRIGFELSFLMASSRLIRDRGRLRVDDDNRLVADLHGRVAAAARDHVDVALHGQHLELGLGRTARSGDRCDDYAERAERRSRQRAAHRGASIARRSSGK